MQGVVEAALATVLRVAPTPALTVAGRTDAGVHARGQVAHVDVPATAWAALGRPGAGEAAEAVVRRLARLLPTDVRVRRVAPAPDGFDARFSALARRYVYRLTDDPAGPDPLRRRDVLWHPRRVDVPRLAEAGGRLLGEHDFAAYCRRRPGAGSVRRLLALAATRQPDGTVEVAVEADAFCHQMVRSVVGALLAVAEGRRPVDWPWGVLAGGVRDPAVNLVPPHGLTLEAVRYPEPAALGVRAEQARARRPLPPPPTPAPAPPPPHEGVLHT